MKNFPIFTVEDVLHEMVKDPSIKRLTHFCEGGKMVARATRRFRPSARDAREEFIVTGGAPNHRERQVMARAKRDKLPPPEKLVAYFPKKKGKR